MSSFSLFYRLTYLTGLHKENWVVTKKHSRRQFFPFPQKGSFQKRDVTITLDRTKHQVRPLLLVVTRLVIEAGGSTTQEHQVVSPSRPTYRRELS